MTKKALKLSSKLHNFIKILLKNEAISQKHESRDFIHYERLNELKVAFSYYEALANENLRW